jgi:hypothetical protein
MEAEAYARTRTASSKMRDCSHSGRDSIAGYSDPVATASAEPETVGRRRAEVLRQVLSPLWMTNRDLSTTRLKVA